MANTGYLIQPRLKKVTNDLNQYPLDINNNLCSISGLPQATMDNSSTNSNYKVLNTTACPIDVPVNCIGYNLSPGGSGGFSVEYFDCNGNFASGTFFTETFICTDGSYNVTSGDPIQTSSQSCTN